MFRRPRYLITLLRQGQLCLDHGTERPSTGTRFPANELTERLSRLRPGDCILLDDLNDPVTQLVQLPGVTPRQARALLQDHWTRFAPHSDWRYCEPDTRQSDRWLLHRLDETVPGDRRRLIATITQCGHRVLAWHTPAQLLTMPQHPRWWIRCVQRFRTPRPAAQAPTLHLLPLAESCLLALAHAGQVLFSRHIAESDPDLAVQTVLPTLFANHLIPHQSSTAPIRHPSSPTFAAQREQLLQGKLPTRSFVPAPIRPIRNIALVGVAIAFIVLALAAWALNPTTSAPPPPLPPAVVSPDEFAIAEQRAQRLLQAIVALSQTASLATDSPRRQRLIWSWDAGQPRWRVQHLDPSTSELQETPLTLTPPDSQPNFPNPVHWHTADRTAWLKTFAQQTHWRDWLLETKPQTETIQLAFNSRHDAQAFQRLWIFLSTSPDLVQLDTCTWSRGIRGLHTQCSGHWRVLDRLTAAPPAPKPNPNASPPPPFGTLFWTPTERHELEMQAREQARQGGWIQRSDGVHQRWKAARDADD